MGHARQEYEKKIAKKVKMRKTKKNTSATKFAIQDKPKIVIKFEDEDCRHPHCPHGPMLRFFYSHRKNDKIKEKKKNGYFACSAFRDRKQCQFFIPATKLRAIHMERKFELPIEKYRELRDKLKKSDLHKLNFCHDCHEPVILYDLPCHVDHNIQNIISKEYLENPTLFLRPLDNDAAHAQYFFDQKALKFFHNCFQNLHIDKVLCIGAPRLHFYLRQLRKANNTNIESFLLDLDHRFYYFLEDDEYAWYNMCNNYFFDEKQKQSFEKFMSLTDFSTLLLFTDPPFACRTEVISNSLQNLARTCNQMSKRLHEPVPIFWIFPYFTEHYIKNTNSEMEMCDFKINYTNHAAYTDIGAKRRFYGSPVRLFTNVPLDLIKLPAYGYKFCSCCNRYTAKENLHCRKCKVCPSKNGSTYRHCELCNVCVKPSYKHCMKCRRCTQTENHDCMEYQKQQFCRICSKRGHIEENCKLTESEPTRPTTKISFKNHKVLCKLCSIYGHHERKCKHRNELINKRKYYRPFNYLARVK